MKKFFSTTDTLSSCAAMRPLLSEFIDGGLPSETAWSVQKHITLCPDCAQCARELQKTISLMGALPSHPLSAAFDAALSVRIAAASAARAQAARSPWYKLRGWLAPAQPYLPIFARPAQRAGLGAAFAAFVIVTGFALNQTLTPTIIHVPAPSVTGSDTALVATCLTQHHATVSNEPLSDPSAQMLDAQLDSEPARAGASAASQAQGLSEADAIALVNETD